MTERTTKPKPSPPAVMPARSALLQRKCACGGTPGPTGECEACRKKRLQRKAQNSELGTRNDSVVPSIVHDVLRSPGQPLDTATRAFMEPRFGQDFSSVRVHTDARAAESARRVNALAYTVGHEIVFAQQRYQPATTTGRRLLVHELTHTTQQRTHGVASRGNLIVGPADDASERQAEQFADRVSAEKQVPASEITEVVQQPALATAVQRQLDPMQQADDMDMEMERKYANSGAPKAHDCGRPSWCPAGFCSPYRSEKLAEYYRSKRAWWLLGGISAVVDSRVVPFWREYLWGGSAPKNITAGFAKDFTNSPTTKKTTTFLIDELKKNLGAAPPAVTSKASIDIATLVPKAIAALDDPASADRMNFSAPRDIPGNLAGDIGKNQTACPAGAKPSPFNDERHASGTVEIARKSASDIVVTPAIIYTVKDTVDLCPGDCGALAEQIATVPLSQFEATGISGDVPFTVEFPAPSLGSFTISAPPPSIVPILAPTSPAPAPAAAPVPKPAPKKPTK